MGTGTPSLNITGDRRATFDSERVWRLETSPSRWSPRGTSQKLVSSLAVLAGDRLFPETCFGASCMARLVPRATF